MLQTNFIGGFPLTIDILMFMLTDTNHFFLSGCLVSRSQTQLDSTLFVIYKVICNCNCAQLIENHSNVKSHKAVSVLCLDGRCQSQ